MEATMVRPRTSWLERAVAALGWLLLPLMVLDLYLIFLYAPRELVQGDAQRIFYIHVPMAWIAYLAFGIVAVASMAYLRTRSAKWDRLARASAEIGVLFTTLVLITGSIWAKPIWGTWWTWDARLTTTLILWFIYVSYLMLRNYATDEARGARYAAVLGIVGAIGVPLNYFSVQLWRTLHPGPVVGPASEGLEKAMLFTFLYSLLVVTLLFLYLLPNRIWMIEVQDELKAIRRMLTSLVEDSPRRNVPERQRGVTRAQ
jgi:heme exporter protein C